MTNVTRFPLVHNPQDEPATPFRNASMLDRDFDNSTLFRNTQ